MVTESTVPSFANAKRELFGSDQCNFIKATKTRKLMFDVVSVGTVSVPKVPLQLYSQTLEKLCAVRHKFSGQETNQKDVTFEIQRDLSRWKIKVS